MIRCGRCSGTRVVAAAGSRELRRCPSCDGRGFDDGLTPDERETEAMRDELTRLRTENAAMRDELERWRRGVGGGR